MIADKVIRVFNMLGNAIQLYIFKLNINVDM